MTNSIVCTHFNLTNDTAHDQLLYLIKSLGTNLLVLMCVCFAQVNMTVDSFESPLTLAACGGHYELAALFISHGADLEESMMKGKLLLQCY